MVDVPLESTVELKSFDLRVTELLTLTLGLILNDPDFFFIF